MCFFHAVEASVNRWWAHAFALLLLTATITTSAHKSLVLQGLTAVKRRSFASLPRPILLSLAVCLQVGSKRNWKLL